MDALQAGPASQHQNLNPVSVFLEGFKYFRHGVRITQTFLRRINHAVGGEKHEITVRKSLFHFAYLFIAACAVDLGALVAPKDNDLEISTLKQHAVDLTRVLLDSNYLHEPFSFLNLLLKSFSKELLPLLLFIP